MNASAPLRHGVLGLGTMGAPMARNLLAAGHRVTVHNRTRAREEDLAAAGCDRAESPAALAAESDVLVVCVSDSPDLAQVLWEDEDAALPALKSGALVIDTSTVSPAMAREAARRCAERGIGWVDAPVSGGPEGARDGTLAIMCGAMEEDFARARPTLDILGAKITRVGPPGAGQVAKAVNQVVISGTYLAVAEGLTLAAKAGVDPRRVREAIQGGAARSWVLDNRAENMIADDYPLGFKLALHRKDLGIALDTARATGVTSLVASLVATLEDGLVARGHGDEDLSAIARAVRRASGLEDGPFPSGD